jgi:hypothetical protein
MKKIALFFCIAICMFFLNCSLPLSDENNPPTPTADPTPTPNPIVSKNIVIYDSDNHKLGNAVSIGTDLITLMTNNNYLVDIGWNGEIAKNLTTWYYELENAEGKVYLGMIEGRPSYGKICKWNDYLARLYKCANPLPDGTALAATPNVLSASCGTSTYNVTETKPCIEMTPTTKTEIGLPDTITLPLIVSFE